MIHVPYKGAVPALTDLIGGQIQLFFDAPTGLINQAKAGKVRLIGAAGERRLPVLPEVPTFIEQGFAGLVGSTWAGMLAPAGTPRPVIERMSAALAEIIKTDETRAKLDAMGTFAVGSTLQAFDAFIAEETAKWGNGIKTAGVAVDQGSAAGLLAGSTLRRRRNGSRASIIAHVHQFAEAQWVVAGRFPADAGKPLDRLHRAAGRYEYDCSIAGRNGLVVSADCFYPSGAGLA